MAIPGWKILRRKLQWSRRCLLHGYSAATPQLLRKLSAAGCGQTKTGHSSVLENTLVAAMRIFKQRDPSTDESAVSPANGLSTDAADDVYAASVLRPLAADIALASFDGF